MIVKLRYVLLCNVRRLPRINLDFKLLQVYNAKVVYKCVQVKYYMVRNQT